MFLFLTPETRIFEHVVDWLGVQKGSSKNPFETQNVKCFSLRFVLLVKMGILSISLLVIPFILVFNHLLIFIISFLFIVLEQPAGTVPEWSESIELVITFNHKVENLYILPECSESIELQEIYS